MDRFDLLVVGGGINGAAVARDAALRGAKVLLVEKDDLAGHTSSASSKLIHGGLRYLEYREFRLVRESLSERETLLRIAPHIVRPLRFVLPEYPGMRPRWKVRIGLWLYDLLALRGSLPRSRVPRRDRAVLAEPLAGTPRLLTYWDASADDARLTVLNAVDAQENGASIATRTELLSAERVGQAWRARLSGGRSIEADAIVNAGGPWVAEVIGRLGASGRSRARLVKGSHIVVPRLWQGAHAYILQQPDGRIVFAMPFEDEFTLVGTTDIAVERPEDAVIGEDEIAYLCRALDRCFARPVAPSDVVWSYSGVRALHDDGAAEAKAVTRDYHLERDGAPGPPLLSILGGKITSARALAERVLDRIGIEGPRSTRSRHLPGGDIYPDFLRWLDGLADWMPAPLVLRLSRAYGTRLKDMIGNARGLDLLGRHFGAGLYRREVDWLREREFAGRAEDILWRRTKLGLRIGPAGRTALEKYMEA